MSGARKAAGWSFILAAIGGVLATVLLTRVTTNNLISLTGTVIRQDSDTKKELPLSDVVITAANSSSSSECRSDSSGFFNLTLRKGIIPGQPVALRFRHPEYQPLELKGLTGDRLYVVRMQPLRQETQAESNRPAVAVADVVVRYSLKAATMVNVGSAVKTFQVVNTGNVPCHDRTPCSPDGKWKAAVASASLDAGQDNEFRNARVSCIAGPCPFTNIEFDGFSQGGRSISVTARNWSDTATFLLEAEVIHPTVSDIVRHSYPVIFGQALNFTLPASAEGVSIEAELKGESIIFPLGPNLFLSWAECNARVNNDRTKVYRCQLKPGYRFR